MGGTRSGGTRSCGPRYTRPWPCRTRLSGDWRATAGSSPPNSPREAFSDGILSPHPGSDPQALPAAPPPFLKHTSAGGRGGPAFPRDPLVGVLLAGTGLSVIATLQDATFHPKAWGRAGRRRQYVSRKERAAPRRLHVRTQAISS